ncbi:heparan-alpha-glucosaminide N-acetyltransferase [Iodobacter sp. CM08]|uniref:heparan-alpha-glucosaminide N-acetyltransferase n=1 Tax=Iodobacter sp. CM08 TaxID=3085902 RepID=UPI00298223B7|nr:heparan-alpha-glucosaminide N-acetyltransferase [Iodobacter sp. CM08]MDW5415243.1 heparan-alpha-glucosaminide N-acetyltransferase [Iodobacter sp. CM08]
MSLVLRPRKPLPDLLRGIAVVLMVLFHFSFDLAYFGVWSVQTNIDPEWVALRTLIVSLFAAVAGLCAGAQPSWQRQLRLLACAGAATLGSWFIFPNAIIWFGVLHFFFVAGLIAPLFRNKPRLCLVLGLLLILLGVLLQATLFDQPALAWLGMMTYKPRTEDYVPMLPWFGVVLLGIAAQTMLPAQWLAQGGQRQLAPLRWLGKHSLIIYLIHQPILFGVLGLLLKK